MIKVSQALISVSDKTGVVDFAKFLTSKGVKILSTGGTLKTLQDAGIESSPIESYTKFPEMMEGRLKTLHPKVHGGLLARLDKKDHVQSMKDHEIESIDLVIVNLYPFAETVAKNAAFEDAIENIDIGGPTMLRSSAKNYKFTTALCDPDDYKKVMDSIDKEGGISEEMSLEFSRKVFNHTASYDAVISGYLNTLAGDVFPENLTLTYKKMQSLRYGENPHQNAAFYRPALEIARDKAGAVSGAEQLQGKELSFNNMLDFSSAIMAAVSLPGNGVVIVKHLNPCGAAMTESADAAAMSEAFLRARECDPISAFGGVIALNGRCDETTAKYITENFVEGVIAREFTDEAKKIFESKKNVRLIRIHDPDRFIKSSMEIRQVYDGILYQDTDVFNSSPSDWKIVTKRKPDEKEMRALHFAWRLVRYVKSNAIVFCSENQSLGIGAGQMSRVDSTEIAILKANKNGMKLEGSAVGSDAFFPFRDGVDALAAAGAKVIIQPGGSVRDDEVIQAADEHGIAMVFTGYRHFRH